MTDQAERILSAASLSPLHRAAFLAAAREAVDTGKAIAIREEAKLSQGEVARLIGVMPPTMSRWESRLRKPTGIGGVRYGLFLAWQVAQLRPASL